MQTKRSAKFNKTADKPFLFESQLQASSAERRGDKGGGYKWQQEARANENWPEKAAGYYNTKRNGTENNEATGKKQSQSNQINANISLKNYESKIERAGGSEKEWVMKGGEGREKGGRGGVRPAPTTLR